MKRREFSKIVLAGAAGIGATGGSTLEAAGSRQRTAGRRNPHMHVGGDYHVIVGGRNADMSSDANLDYNLRHGMRHLTIVMRHGPGNPYDLDDMKRMRDNCDRKNVDWEALRMMHHYIRMRPGDERKRELEIITGNIAKAAAVGVKVITYHLRMIRIQRNTNTPGRGGSTYRGFKLEEDWKNLPVGEAGKVDHEEYWERITTFLETCVPVAAEYDVRLACHPYDPPGLPFGYRGVDNWDSPDIFEAFKRYEAIVDSPYNSFQVCLGTMGEGVKNPLKEVPPMVQYLADRDKIGQIHMRNIKGSLGEFEEVYTDNGDMDFLEIIRILRDAGFKYSICPDHMPSHPDDPGKFQAFAFASGYIKGLIQSANSEPGLEG